jgi:hypothetical protein
MEETFSTQSMLRCYKQDQLPVAVGKMSEELVRHLVLIGFSDLNEMFVGQSDFTDFTLCSAFAANSSLAKVVLVKFATWPRVCTVPCETSK